MTLVQLSFDFYMLEAKPPENLVGDRVDDSDPLDEQLRREGIEMIAPQRKNRKRRKTQDGRRLRRYQSRWLVERFFDWIQWQRRTLIRWEYYAENFLGFVQLPCSNNFEIGSRESGGPRPLLLLLVRSFPRGNGGRYGTRTHDLRVANAALSQLS